ncbi:MAG: UDP-N-acetylmuramoyl-tripeptide--D-alanyl-D-alanine ligase [Planctomycetota bacterium]
MPQLSEDAGLLTARRVAEITGGRLLSGSGEARGIATDSRSTRPGDLFVAVEGERHDGHQFVAEAVARGARGLLVARPCSPLADRLPSDEPPSDEPYVVEVADTRRALSSIARAHRKLLSASAPGLQVAAITGSCGKTSTKEMASHMLAPFVSLVAAERSFNNDIGLPLTLLRAKGSTELCLLEIGTNQPGDIARLAEVAAPDIAVITMVGRAHLAGLGSIDGVLREKSSLLEFLSAEGVAILNADERHFDALARLAGARRILSFGIHGDADLRARNLRPEADGVSLQLVCRDEGPLAARLPRFGMHNVKNCLAALAIGKALGLSAAELVSEIPSLPQTPRRLELKTSGGGVQVLDDSFNANPDSLLAALSVMDSWSGARRRILVLGDMLELGPSAREIHASIGGLLVGRIDRLLTVGPLAGHSAERFVQKSQRPELAERFRDTEELGLVLPGMFREGDLVLFKGSRHMSLDRLVDLLLGRVDDVPLVSPGPVSYHGGGELETTASQGV